MDTLTTVLIVVLGSVLRVLFPFLAEKSKSTAEDGARQVDLRDRLRKRVRETWKNATRLLICAAAVLLVAGCGARTIYVPDGTPVRLRETVHSAKVWVLDAQGRPVEGMMDLPEGWYCLPDPGP